MQQQSYLHPPTLVFWLFLAINLLCITQADAQLTSRVDCFLPAAWEGKEAKLVVKPLGQPFIIDTAVVTNRHAIFTVTLAEFSPAYIWVEDVKEDIHFFLDAPTIAIAIDPLSFDPPLLSGSPSSELWNQQRKEIHEIIESQANIRIELPLTQDLDDSSFVIKQEPIIDSLRKAYADAIAAMITNNPTSYSSWHLFLTHFPFASLITTSAVFDKLGSFSKLASYQKIQQQLARNQIGQKAIDFRLPSLSADSISLSTTKGAYTLIDFSMPIIRSCKRRHNALKKLYATYHPLGLEIVTIMHDFDRQSATAALTKENLPWLVAISVEGASTITDDYLAKPTGDNVLLDHNQRIVARNLTLPELEAQLKTLQQKK